MSAISDAFFELDRNNQMLSCRVFGSHIRGILLPQPNYQYTRILLYEPSWFVGVPLRSWEIKSRAAEAQRGSQVAHCYARSDLYRLLRPTVCILMCPMTARPLVAPRRTCYFTDELHFYNRPLHLLYPFFPSPNCYWICTTRK